MSDMNESNALKNALDLASDLEDDNFRGNTTQIVNVIRALSEEYEDISRSNKLRGNWLPIKTAPKDGTKILLAKIDKTAGLPEYGLKPMPPHVWWCTQGYWSNKWNNWNDGVEPSGLAGPNYWMPVPSCRSIVANIIKSTLEES